MKALTFCELYALHEDDFRRTCHEFPEDASVIQEIALGRLAQDLTKKNKKMLLQGVNFDTDTVFEDAIRERQCK